MWSSPQEARQNGDSLSLSLRVDSPPESIFDDISALATHICQTPIALVISTEQEQHVIKSIVGQEPTTAHGAAVFHVHTMRHPDAVLAVADTLEDARFANTPLVTSAPWVRFYAGAPLVSSDGRVLGSLCVMDLAPRQLTSGQTTALVRLARCLVNQLAVHQQRGQEQQETISALLNALPDSALLLSAKGTILTANDIAAQRLGVGAEELVGQSPEKFLPPSLAVSRKTKLEEVVHTRQPVTFQDERNGRHYETRIRPITDASGRVRHLAVFAHDITDRKQEEEALRVISNELFPLADDDFFQRAVLKIAELAEMEVVFIAKRQNHQQSKMQILAMRRDQSVIPGFEYDLQGTPCANVVGKSFCIYPNNVRNHFPTDRMLRDFNISAYAGIPLWDTQGRPLGVVAMASRAPIAHPSYLEKLLRLFATPVAAAIERRNAEKELLASEQQLRQILDSLYGFVGLFTPDGAIIEANRAPLEAAGLRRDEVLGKPFWDISWWTHDAEVQTQLRAALSQAAQGELVRYETSVRLANDRLIDLDVMYGPLTDTHGVVRNIIGFGVDITDRKQAERQIKTALEEKEVLLKEIHHRVKNNLQIVSSLLYLQARKTDNQELQAVLQESRSRILSMSLIHQKLYQSTDLAHIKFSDYARDLTQTLFRTYGVGPAKVGLSIEGNSLTLDIDHAVPCGLIMNEVVSNSLKYAFPQGRRGIVHIELQQDQTKQHHLILSDNGVGFPEGFDLRARSSLGMTLIERLTEQLQGRMERQSSAQGTTYHIAFPKKL